MVRRHCAAIRLYEERRVRHGVLRGLGNARPAPVSESRKTETCRGKRSDFQEGADSRRPRGRAPHAGRPRRHLRGAHQGLREFPGHQPAPPGVRRRRRLPQRHADGHLRPLRPSGIRSLPYVTPRHRFLRALSVGAQEISHRDAEATEKKILSSPRSLCLCEKLVAFRQLGSSLAFRGDAHPTARETFLSQSREGAKKAIVLFLSVGCFLRLRALARKFLPDTCGLGLHFGAIAVPNRPVQAFIHGAPREDSWLSMFSVPL